MPNVIVEEDLVMQHIIRAEGIRLVDRVEDPEILLTAWRVLTAGEAEQTDEVKDALRAGFLSQPYRLAYEAWRTLQDYLEPPQLPDPRLQRIAAQLDRFMGIASKNRNPQS